MNETNKTRVVFFGTPDFVIPIAHALAETFDLVGVVTTPDVPQGRKKILTPTPVKQWYMEHLLSHNKEGVILTPETLTQDVAIRLRKLHPDFFVTAAYGKLIPKSILTIPTIGALNVHPSGLPKYRGPSPIQSTILDGHKTLGITIIQMDQELDHGPILSSWEIPIESDDTFASLHIKAFQEAANKLPGIMSDFASGNITPVAQNHSEATFCEKVTKNDGYFDVSNPPEPERLQRMIKAYFPWPTAWTKIKVKDRELRLKFMPGNIIQLEGGKPMKLKEFINGYPEFRGMLEKLL